MRKFFVALLGEIAFSFEHWGMWLNKTADAYVMDERRPHEKPDLTWQQKQRFEVHMKDCEYCLAQVRIARASYAWMDLDMKRGSK